MRAIDYLTRIKTLDMSIDRKVKQIAMWKDMAFSISKDTTQPHYNPNRTTSAPYERCIKKADELEREVTDDIDRLADMKTEALQTIALIDDEDEQLILKLRYIDLLPWEKVMRAAGYSRTAVHNRKQEGLRKLDAILEKKNIGEHP